MKRKKKVHWIQGILCGLALLTVPMATGCQSSIAGQTLPSAYYLKDDIQYYRKGPEFKLTNEANALKAAQAENVLRNQ